MYFVNINKLNEKLNYLDQNFPLYESQAFDSVMEHLALERLVHVMIETILDVGNMLIDGFVMRDPGSYADIIDILVDEKVIPEQEQKAYQDLIALRKMIVNQYDQVDHNRIKNSLDKNKDIYLTFSQNVKSFLENETGVANTFSHE
ncbi:DUF86 domain-containing protein [Gracilibacillus sp. YIM 98692]|uniref:DUF86 domain-containing protein n=1 Tax=Gracilibacillus sp. YIM 98692 TaxID=2663532 RepID=UPI0013D71553|nr:DUF86 domain-containing protein [Gracilibacillus sp. YIM 98692]